MVWINEEGHRVIRPGTVLASLPDLGLALIFLVVAIAPERFAADTGDYLRLLIIVEFPVILSAAVIGFVLTKRLGTGRTLLTVGALVLVFSLLAFGIGDAFGEVWPLWLYWALTLNRLMSVVLAPRGLWRTQNINSWAAGYAIYISLIFLAIPMARVLAGLGLNDGMMWGARSMLWFGFVYFLLTAWSELTDYRWIRYASKEIFGSHDLYGNKQDQQEQREEA